jgi:hypothetical protein
MINKIFSFFYLVFFLVMVFSCSTTSDQKRFSTLSTSRNVKYDDITQVDPKLDVPLWASNLKMYEKRLIENKRIDADKYKYYSAQSTVASRGSIETCYKMALMNIKGNISSLINEAFSGEIGMSREGDSEKHMVGYVKDVMANVTKNVFSGLEREDVFYKEIMDNHTDNISYQCFVLYSIKKTNIERLKIARKNENNIPKEAKENIERALESTREMLIKP